MCMHFLVAYGLTYMCVKYYQLRLGSYERRLYHGEAPPSDEPQFVQYASVRKLFVEHHTTEEMQALIKSKGVENFDEHFVFSLYLNINQDRLLMDFYNFNIISWGFILGFKFIECIVLTATLDIHNYKWGIECGMDLMLILVGIVMAICTLFALHRITKKNQNAKNYHPKPACVCIMCDNDPNGPRADPKNLGEIRSIETWFCRMFQAFSFALCYEFAAKMTNKSFWEATDIGHYPFGESALHGIYASILIVSLIAFCFLLVAVVQRVCFDFAMPPYMDIVTTHICTSILISYICCYII